MEPDQFTLDEANGFIPWLAERFKKLNMLQQEYAVIQDRIGDLRIASYNSTDAFELKATSNRLTRQIDETIEEILDQGIIVRDVSSGLVDFPSRRDDRDIYLCWIEGEEQVRFWHEIDEGFSYRQPI